MCVGTHPFIPASNVFKCVVVYDQYGQKMANVFNVLSGGGHVLADMDRIFAKLQAWIQVEWKGAASNTASCSLVTIKDLTTEDGIGKDYPVSPTITGSFTQAGVPGNVTVAVKWTTGFSGRSRRGRSYMVGISPTYVSGNTISPANVTALTTAWTALLTRLAGGGTVDKLCIVSYCGDEDWRTTALVTPVTGCSVEASLDSQRRRLTGRGA